MKSKTQKGISDVKRRFATIEFQRRLKETCFINYKECVYKMFVFPMGLSTAITILAINIMYSQKFSNEGKQKMQITFVLQLFCLYDSKWAIFRTMPKVISIYASECIYSNAEYCINYEHENIFVLTRN